MARYNAWMNTRIYDVAGQLPPGELAAPRGAFFGSILGTLNHLVVADLIWLRRFASHRPSSLALEPVLRMEAPQALDQVLHTELEPLAAQRRAIDAAITGWVAALEPAELEEPLRYANTKGEPFCRPFGSLILHFFNHQTHHRGQASTLLTQAGHDVGVTDLLVLIPSAG